MNTNQPPYGPGANAAHQAEQTRLLGEIRDLLKRIAKALEKDKS